MQNRARIFLFWLLVWVVGGFALSMPVRAQGLQITPITIELQPGQMTTTLMIVNKGTSTAALQLRPFRWSQSGGQDVLTPTTELAVSPPISAVEAGQPQTFRLVLRRPATSQEASYRLLLDQLPPPAAPGSVRVALRFSIPVFAEPAARVERNLSWRILTGPDSFLVVQNLGGRHVRILDPVLTQANGTRLAMQKGQAPYLLPGTERRWQIQAGATLRPGSTLHLVATSDGGPIDATVRVSGP